jgi:hypothetical protein
MFILWCYQIKPNIIQKDSKPVSLADIRNSLVSLKRWLNEVYNALRTVASEILVFMLNWTSVNKVTLLIVSSLIRSSRSRDAADNRVGFVGLSTIYSGNVKDGLTKFTMHYEL